MRERGEEGREYRELFLLPQIGGFGFPPFVIPSFIFQLKIDRYIKD
jgi:hypothetical protein